MSTVTGHPVYRKGEVSFDQRAQEIAKADEQRLAWEKRSKGSPFEEFAQVNLGDASLKTIDRAMRENPAAFRLFLQLVKLMDGYNAVMASYKVLTRILEVSPPTVTRAVKYLRDNELIKVYKSGTSNVYALNDGIVWKSWGSNRKYSAFSNENYVADFVAEVKTNVVLASAEQDEDTQILISQRVRQRNLKQVQVEEVRARGPQDKELR